MYRGGLLLAEIRDALGNDPSLIDQFTILFGREHAFSRDTIETAYKYFIKVFCNLRAKDVALKYNSNLNASNTVGLRQTLAGGITIGKSKQKSKRKTTNTGASKYANLRVAELKKLCRERGLITGGLKADLVARLEEHGDDRVDGTEEANATDEPDEEVDRPTNDTISEETEHNDMLSALDEDDALRDDDYNNAEKIGTRNVIDNALENDM